MKQIREKAAIKCQNCTSTHSMSCSWYLGKLQISTKFFIGLFCAVQVTDFWTFHAESAETDLLANITEYTVATVKNELSRWHQCIFKHVEVCFLYLQVAPVFSNEASTNIASTRAKRRRIRRGTARLTRRIATNAAHVACASASTLK